MNAQKTGDYTCPTRSINASEIENAVVSSLKKIAQDVDLQKAKINSLLKAGKRDIITLSEKEASLSKKLTKLCDKLNNATDKESPQSLKIRDDIAETEQAISETKIKKAEVKERMISREEFQKALIVTLPLWDNLLLPEQKRVIDILVQRIDYNLETGKLGIKLNEKGIKLLQQELS
jgi:site-specific DNA recombinase